MGFFATALCFLAYGLWPSTWPFRWGRSSDVPWVSVVIHLLVLLVLATLLWSLTNLNLAIGGKAIFVIGCAFAVAVVASLLVDVKSNLVGSRGAPTVGSPALQEIPQWRIPFYKAAEIAKNDFGWRIGDPRSCDIIDLAVGVRQAHLDGLVPIYGRFDCYNMPESMWQHYPLVEIPKDHLKTFWLSAAAHQPLSPDNRRHVITYLPGRIQDLGKDAYVDVHVNTDAFRTWLAGDGLAWKGTTDAERARKGKAPNEA